MPIKDTKILNSEKKYTSEFKIPNKLEDIKGQKFINQIEKKVEEVTEVYVENRQIQLKLDDFLRKTEEIWLQWEAEGKSTLVFTLRLAQHQLHYNKWSMTLPSESHKKIVDNERDKIIIAVRNAVNVKDLFFEINVDVKMMENMDIPMTQQEKFQLLIKKNTNIFLLQEIFKTRIIS